MVSSLPSMAAPCQLLPCSHSWVALHPQPKGVLQFIGSALFGMVPTLSYRYFLESLFEAGYTVVALPFRFTLNHWSVALELLDEHYTLRAAMVEMAMAKGYDPAVYLDAANYAWIGHGAGCKCITLLELLSSADDGLAGFWQTELQSEDFGQLRVIRQGLACLSPRLRLLEEYLQRLTGKTVDWGQPSIMHQASLLLAPEMTDPVFVKLLRLSGSSLLSVFPSMTQTHKLIERSRLFRLTGLIQFARDRKTANTCQRLMQEQPHIRRRLLKGNHLEPVGLRFGQFVVDFNPLDKFVQTLSCRDLEFKTLTLLHRLRKVPPSSRQPKCAANSSRPRLAA